MAVLRPDLMMKCVIPVVMAGIIAIVRHFLYRVVAQANEAVRSRCLRSNLW